MLPRKLLTLLLVSGLLFITCKNRDIDTVNQFYPDILPLQDYQGATVGMMSLPMNPLPLEDLEAFESPSANWQIAGDASADYRAERYVRYQSDDAMEVTNGTGVLVNRPTEESRSDLYTKLEHGDIELKVEFMVPRGSNSGIYFQGRYELQIVDIWGVEEPTYGSLGGIYQRWDESRPEGQEGYDGVAPMVNASLAPGLWQEFHVLFRAPRFDVDGNKVGNARFEKVFLNGQLIHEDVELSGPTRGSVSEEEVAYGPLRIQGTHGPVAFRNIGYKKYSRSDSLRLGPLEYIVYDYQGELLLEPKVFDSLPVLARGITDSLNVSQLSPRDERFAMWFFGQLKVPVSGEYLFQTLIATGGNLYINGDLVTADDGSSYFTLRGKIIHLEQGTHRLEISYFMRRYVNPLTLIYEGPGMERRTLASSAFGSGQETVSDRLTVEPDSGQPEFIGGFIRYGDENQTHVNTLGHPGLAFIGMADPESQKKRVHTLSIGHPEGVHYTYDLGHSSLLKFWRGFFADVTGLWRGPFGGGESFRGYGDLKILVPLNAAVEKKTEIAIARLREGELLLFQDLSEGRCVRTPAGSGVQEYLINEAGHPVFKFDIDGVEIEDEIFPTDKGEGLGRILRYYTDADRNDLVSVIAQGEQTDRLSVNLFRVKNYFVELDETEAQQFSIHEKDGRQALVLPILRGSRRSEVHYRIIW